MKREDCLERGGKLIKKLFCDIGVHFVVYPVKFLMPYRSSRDMYVFNRDKTRSSDKQL